MRQFVYNGQQLKILEGGRFNPAAVRPLLSNRSQGRVLLVGAGYDPFHVSVSDYAAKRLLCAIALLAGRHHIRLRTSNPARLARLFKKRKEWISTEAKRAARQLLSGKQAQADAIQTIESNLDSSIPNTWIGISVSTKSALTKRIVHLMRIPAEVRFLDITLKSEPMNLFGYEPFVDWVIVGGTFGKNANKVGPIHPQWVKDIRDECHDAKVPFFFAGWGVWRPMESNESLLTLAELYSVEKCPGNKTETFMVNTGVKKAGRLIDGRLYEERPPMRQPS